SQAQCTVSVVEFGGVNRSGSNGSGAIGQSNTARADGVNSLSVSLPSGESVAGAAVFAAIANTNGTNYNHKTGWEGIHSIQSTSPLNRTATAYNPSFDQEYVGTLASGATTGMGAIIVEILPFV